MRKIPAFPHYRMAKPPAARRWLGAGAATVLLSGGSVAMVQTSGENPRVMLICMLVMAMLCGVAWSVRALYFRFSVHHSLTWQGEVKKEHRHWWEIHQRQFALKEIVLLGPAGTDLSDWLRVIQREQPVPPVRQETSGKVMRVARLFTSELMEREKQLAQMLVLQWKQQRKGEPAIFPEKFFWLGSDGAWQAFVTQLKVCFPGMKTPEIPEQWQGEETLSLLAEALGDKTHQGCYLIAGCQSLPPSFDDFRLAGEGAVLWLAGSQGDVMLSRGEVFEPSDTETLQQVTLRAEKQSGLDESPDVCMLFSHPEQPELASCGWCVTHNILDDYLGAPGKLDALLVISLAAISAKSAAKPCCWIASDPLHTLALGIVKPHGN